MVDDDINVGDLKCLWLYQVNKLMNDYIGKKVMGCILELSEQLNILQDYVNILFVGLIIVFDKYLDDFVMGEVGLICLFGVGYLVGLVIVWWCQVVIG